MDTGLAGDRKVELINQLKEIAELEKKVKEEAAEAGEGVEKQMAAEAKKFLANREMLSDLQAQYDIQRELTAGHETAAKALTIQRDLAKELDKIAESDLTPAERERANQLARQTAELQQQKILAEQLAAQRKADAQLGVDTAGPSVLAQRRARVAKSVSDKSAELEAAGFSGADLEGRLGKFEGAENRRLQREQGRIGGTTRSPRDSAPLEGVPEVFMVMRDERSEGVMRRGR